MTDPDEINGFVSQVYPAMGATGLRCVAVEPGRAQVMWPLEEAQLRPGGYISGPTQFFVIDAALWMATFTLIGLEPMAVTSDIQLSFLRPAMGGDLWAEATVVSQTRRRIHGTIRVWVGDDRERLVTHAAGSYALPDGVGA